MNNEEINRAMAEKVLGWRFISGDEIYALFPNTKEIHNPHVEGIWIDKDDNKMACVECGDLPEWCNDLNLVHKEELKLVEEGRGSWYNFYLHRELDCKESCDGGDCLKLILADAKTRCLAIIKTKEDKTR